MGTGASSMTIPATIDKTTAQSIAGDQFDEKAFDAAAKDGVIGKDEFLKAAEKAKSSGMPTYVSSHSRALVEAARSLAPEQVKGSFLGAEVKDKNNAEAMLDNAWKALDRGDLSAAVELTNTLLAQDPTREKVAFTRGLAYARQGEWRYAAADYAQYLKLQQATSGPTLANAYYGRALCLAKMGHRAAALKDLNECIRVGPHDEQITEGDTSLVPAAKVAKFALLQAFPELGGFEQEVQAKAAASATAPAAEEGSANDEPVWKGKLWRAPVTQLEGAIERAQAAGKVPLLLDSTSNHATDNFFLYCSATIVEAKKMVLDVRMAGVSMEAAREKLREQLVHAMRWGHLLVVRMANTAADFSNSYCAAETFPSAVFDQKALPSGKDAVSDPTFSKVLRPADTKAASGRLAVPSSFGVVVTSTFKVDTYEELLKDSLPISQLQAIEVFEPSALARAAEMAGQGPTNTGPLSGIVSDWGGAWNSTPARTKGDAPKAGQLQGDRTSLFLSN